jgi:ATP-dependent Clp protease ATP-binding subunit ClpB
MLEDLRGRLRERQITVDVSDKARRHIAEEGFDVVYGARPLRRFIAHDVETRIARLLLANDVRDGAVIRIDVREGEIAIEFENPRDDAEAAA